MNATRFVMVGGFLGAGKTTTILALARRFHTQGQRVGIVTNDQASDLVDTRVMQAGGFDVSEIAGGCFCCRFDELKQATPELDARQHPDVILAEPVGSCTDLAATVLEPLRRYHGRFELGPLAVLVKPEHGRRILLNDQPLGVSREAAYIFEKQIEEADIIAINKVDRLEATERAELVQALSERFPQAETMAISAKEGTGIDPFFAAIRDRVRVTQPFMDLDYDRYADGEADLGWLNGSFEVTAPRPCALNDVAVSFLRHLASALEGQGGEPAHIKVAVQSDDGVLAVANLVAGGEPVELTLAAEATTSRASVTLNARAVISPDQLDACTTQALRALAQDQQLEWRVLSQQSFQPGRPEPTHQFR
ncbi:MAG: GTP-binding protein [Planctomycetota bacterium]